MQGFIASLLAVMMTGMVFSQQPQNNNFQSRQTENPKLLGLYLLIVDQDVVRTLKTHGFRSANIKESDRPTVDHVVFHASNFNAERAERENIEPFNIQPVPPMDGDDTLVFELNDHYLNLLQKKGLRYILRPQDIGRFKVLTIKYDGPTQAVASLPTTRPGSPLTPRNDNGLFKSDSRTGPPDPRIVRNTTDEYGAPYYGPSLPDDWERRTTQSTVDSDTFRPRLGSIATRREQPVMRQPQRDLYSNDLQQDRDVNTLPTTRRDDPLAIRDVRNRNLLNDRVAANTPFENRTFRSDTQLPRTDRLGNQSLQPVTTDYDPVLREELRQRNAQNRTLDQMNQSLADQNEALRRQLEDERLANRRDRLAMRTDPRASAYDQDYNYDTPRRRRDYDNQIIVQPPINTAEAMPERVAVNPKPSSRLLPFAIEGPNAESGQQESSGSTKTVDPRIVADAERYRKQNAALWFIMLCSVGINFYLAWIARGFYVRYEELADDIRETFTSSM